MIGWKVNPQSGHACIGPIKPFLGRNAVFQGKGSPSLTSCSHFERCIGPVCVRRTDSDAAQDTTGQLGRWPFIESDCENWADGLSKPMGLRVTEWCMNHQITQRLARAIVCAEKQRHSRRPSINTILLPDPKQLSWEVFGSTGRHAFSCQSVTDRNQTPGPPMRIQDVQNGCRQIHLGKGLVSVCILKFVVLQDCFSGSNTSSRNHRLFWRGLTVLLSMLELS